MDARVMNTLIKCADGGIAAKPKQRESNFELFRIVVMLFIVAHHYVVNSGLIDLVCETKFGGENSFSVAFWGMG